MDTKGNELEKLLDTIVTKAWIRKSEGKQRYKEGIYVFKLDRKDPGEESEGELLITIENDKENICAHLGMHGWPSCDYLHMCFSSNGEKAYVYLIEQTDVTLTVETRMKKKIGKYSVISEEEFGDTFKELDALGDAISFEKKLRYKAKLIMNSMVEENCRKFAYSVATIIKLQTLPEFADFVTEEQIYNFVRLNVTIKKSLHFGTSHSSNYTAKEIAKIEKHLDVNLMDYQEGIEETIGNKIKGLGQDKKAKIRIRSVINRYNKLIDDIHMCCQ